MKAGLIILGLIFINIINAHAQSGGPCDFGDPDANCPLDTWVYVLVAAALFFAVFNLYRRQRSQSL